MRHVSKKALYSLRKFIWFISACILALCFPAQAKYLPWPYPLQFETFTALHPSLPQLLGILGQEAVLLDYTNNQIIQRFHAEEGPISEAQISPNGQWVAGLLKPNLIKIWNLNSGQLLAQNQDPLGNFHRVVWDAQKPTVYAFNTPNHFQKSRDYLIQWNWKTKQKYTQTFEPDSYQIQTMIQSQPYPTIVRYRYQNEGVRVYQWQNPGNSLKLLKELPGSSPFSPFLISQEGISIHSENFCTSYRFKDQKQQRILAPSKLQDYAFGVQYGGETDSGNVSPDHRWLIARRAYHDRYLGLIQLSSEKLLAKWPEETQLLWFSPDSQKVMLKIPQKGYELWQLAEGKPKRLGQWPMAHYFAQATLRFSPNKHYLGVLRESADLRPNSRHEFLLVDLHTQRPVGQALKIETGDNTGDTHDQLLFCFQSDQSIWMDQILQFYVPDPNPDAHPSIMLEERREVYSWNPLTQKKRSFAAGQLDQIGGYFFDTVTADCRYLMTKDYTWELQPERRLKPFLQGEGYSHLSRDGLRVYTHYPYTSTFYVQNFQSGQTLYQFEKVSHYQEIENKLLLEFKDKSLWIDAPSGKVLGEHPQILKEKKVFFQTQHYLQTPLQLDSPDLKHSEGFAFAGQFFTKEGLTLSREGVFPYLSKTLTIPGVFAPQNPIETLFFEHFEIVPQGTSPLIWDLNAKQSFKRLKGRGAFPLHSMALSQDRQLLATLDQAGLIQIYLTRNWQAIAQFYLAGGR